MNLSERYAAAVQRAADRTPDTPQLLPTVLLEACVEVLAVDGAGLSLTQDLRVPLGATSEHVARAESLQTTLGEGPCLSASALDQPLVADLDLLQARWPLFRRELVRQTPFRSVATVPLQLPEDRRRLGAVDLYSTDPRAGSLRNLNRDWTEITTLMTALLVRDPRSLLEPGEAGSADRSPSYQRRMDVWMAVGMVIGLTGMANPDALAVLRAYAFSNELSLDELAQSLITGTTATETVLR